MLCKSPYMIGGTAPARCGSCLPCRFATRRLWTHRLLLESLKHESSCFVTLTYNRENEPQGMTLVKSDPQDWLKRLRSKIEPLKVRYYLVGEYGDQTQRPHYHLALFGLGPEHQSLLEETWKLGHVHSAELNWKTAQYICGYVTKKMTKKDDPRLKGRAPEFASMSLKPGIGATAMEDVRLILESSHGADKLSNDGDVPSLLRSRGKLLPLGRYLKRKLREYYGFKDTSTPEPILHKMQKEMHEMLDVALQDPKNRSKSLKRILIEKNAQKILSIEARNEIFSKKGNL